MQTEKSVREKLWTVSFISISTAFFIVALVNHIFISLSSIYTELITGNVAYAGLATGVFSLVALVLRPFSGGVADKWDRRRILILMAALFTISIACHRLALTLVLLLIFRALSGIFFCFYSTTSGAVVPDLLPQSRISEGMGYYSLATVLAPAIGPALGLFILGPGEIDDFKRLFTVATIFAAIMIICTLFIKVPPRANDPLLDKKTNSITTAEKDLPKLYFGFEAATFLPGGIITLVTFVFSGLSSFIAMYMLSKGFSNSTSSIYFIIYASGMFIMRGFTGKIADRRGPDEILLFSIVCSVAAFTILALTGNITLIYFAGLLAGFGFGGMLPFLNVYIIKRCSPQRRGSAAAMYFASMDLGFGIGPICLGVFIDHWGYSITFFICAAIAILFGLIYTLFLSSRYGIFKKDRSGLY